MRVIAHGPALRFIVLAAAEALDARFLVPRELERCELRALVGPVAEGLVLGAAAGAVVVCLPLLKHDFELAPLDHDRVFLLFLLR